jgi:hypothetical protein
MCKKCWGKFEDYHKTSTERLLKRYEHIVAFNTTSSRWGLIAILIGSLQILIAISFALYGWYMSLFFIYRPWEEYTSMNTWIVLVWIGAIVTLILAISVWGFITWITIYFVRTTRVTTPELEAIQALNKKLGKPGRTKSKRQKIVKRGKDRQVK